MSIPPPPPGFEIVPAPQSVPPPPDGFQLVSEGAGRFAQPNLAGSIDPRGRVDREVANEDLGPKPLAFGIPLVGPYLEEAMSYVAAAPNAIAGVGPTREQSLERMRARNRKAEADYPIQDPVGQAAAGIATGAPLARVFSPAAGMVGNMFRGGAAGTVIGGIEGFGRGEGGVENRIDNAMVQAAVGGVIGAALPPVAAGAGKVISTVGNRISPTVARFGASPTGQRLNAMLGGAEPPPRSLSAAAPDGGGGVPPGIGLPPVTGADAAAEQVIANQLARANLNTTDIRQRFAQARQANAGLPNATALADLDESLARLGGSVKRQQPEAGNIARTFIQGRQTGITPPEGMPVMSGIPTRAMMEARQPNAPPMGQGERVLARLRQEMNIPAGSAYQNEQAIIKAQKKEANKLFGEAYKIAGDMDVTPTIRPILDKWRTIADDAAPGIANPIRWAIKQYEAKEGKTIGLKRFQDSKEFVDGKVTGLIEALDSSRNRKLGGILGKMQEELRGAIDQIPKVGEAYGTARMAFSSSAKIREAISLGTKAARGDAEVSRAVYETLEPGQQQAFRMALFGDIERQVKRTPRQNDVTRIFDTPNMQDLLQGMMAQPGALGTGRFLQGEKAMVGTNRTVVGGSPTRERTVDDEATDQITGLIDQLRSTRTLRDAAFAVTQKTLDTLLGFKADTAAAVARKLFTANPGEVDRILQQIERRLGPDRGAQFRTLMQEHYAAIAKLGAAGTHQQQSPQQPGASMPRQP